MPRRTNEVTDFEAPYSSPHFGADLAILDGWWFCYDAQPGPDLRRGSLLGFRSELPVNVLMGILAGTALSYFLSDRCAFDDLTGKEGA